jgi:hypothetical protein
VLRDILASEYMNIRIRSLLFAFGVVSLIGAGPALGATSIPSYTPMFSDFNGDNQVDQVTLTSEGLHKHIRILLGKSMSHSLHFETEVNDRERLYYGDFDNDGDIDLLWLSPTNPRSLVMWEGDGRGNFSKSNHGEDVLHSPKTIEEPPPSKTIDDSGEQGMVCTISSVFCGGPIHAPPRLRLPRSEKLISTDRLSSIADHFESVSTERGPPPSPSSR